uniref:Uncharacterized protein n=1 Tax=Oryza brachyantha TaxID=4533 RepID=J3MKX0_ORYBR
MSHHHTVWSGIDVCFRLLILLACLLVQRSPWSELLCIPLCLCTVSLDAGAAISSIRDTPVWLNGMRWFLMATHAHPFAVDYQTKLEITGETAVSRIIMGFLYTFCHHVCVHVFSRPAGSSCGRATLGGRPGE